MKDRPHLAYEGATYERQTGEWTHTRTRLAVPFAVGRRLDALAKQDLSVWNAVCAQDFHDDPKNKGHFLICPIDESLDSTPRPGTTASPQRARRSRQTHSLDWAFDRNQVLILTCDVAAGWRRTERSWCVRSSARVELPRGFTLRATVALLEDTWEHPRRYSLAYARDQGGSMADPDECHPEFEPVQLFDGPIVAVLEDRKCTCKIEIWNRARDFNGALPWRTKGRGWNFEVTVAGVYEKAIRYIADEQTISRPFRFTLSATLHPPKPDRASPTYEYDTPFPSAGLPSLGRKR